MNAPWVDNSYKWGGGGILSSAPDLIELANHVSEIFMSNGSSSMSGVVSRNTLTDLLWNPVKGTLQGSWLAGGLYGLGWFVARLVDPHFFSIMRKSQMANLSAIFCRPVICSSNYTILIEIGYQNIPRMPSYLSWVLISLLPDN